MVELLNAIARLWWNWTASMFWQVGLLILVIAGIDLLIRKWAWPQLRYALWSLVLVKLLLPPTLSLPSAVVPGLKPVVAQVARWLEVEKPATRDTAASMADPGFRIADSPLSLTPQFQGFPVSAGGSVTIYDAGDDLSFHAGGHPQAAREDATPPEADTPSSVGRLLSSTPLIWQFYAMSIWLLGTLILGIWLFLRLHSVAGRQASPAAAASLPQSFYNHLADCATRLGLRRIPRVVVTKRLTSPAVFGVWAPVLLMPKGYLSKLSRRDTEHMLLHELAHIKRGDLAMHSLYLLLQIVYWYHPLLWLVRRHIHHLRELSCDGTVAELLRERTPAYRQTLLETARRMLTTSVEPGLGLLGLFEDSNYLLVRLDWLTKPTWRYRTMKRAVVATSAVLMFACVLPMAQGQESAPADVTRVSTSEVVSDPVAGDNQQTQDQVSRDIARLQAQLEQLMAQQRGLQKQLEALSQQRRPAATLEHRREVVGRPSTELVEIYRVREGDTLATIARKFYGPENLQENIARLAERNHVNEAQGLRVGQELQIPARGAPRDPTAQIAHERQLLLRAHEQAQRAQDEAKQAAKEADLARLQAERARAEALHLQAQNQGQPDWAQSMQAYGDQMGKWGHSEQMKKWEEDMARWGQKMGQWGQEFGRRQAAAVNGSMSDSEVPPMPPMPAMPAMPPAPTAPPAPAVPMPEVHTPALEPPVLPAIPEKEDGREEATSRREQTVDLAAGQLLDVVNEVGSIYVHGGDGPGGKIVATIKAKADTKEKAAQIVDQVELVVTPMDGGVRVSMTKPGIQNKREGLNYQVLLDVTVPRNARLRASQAAGGICLGSLRGTVDASVKAGSIQANDVSGRVALSVDAGSIEFIAPRDFSAKVQAKANVGAIQSDFPLEFAKSRGVAVGSSASGTIGEGEGELSLKTNAGSIQIRQQGAEPTRGGRIRPAPAPRPETRSQPESQPREVF
jgi:beta-lactamase regulating signal transducer with metallopeptidase domain/LysM repeat protein